MKKRKFINPYLGGVLLGIVLFASFFLTGNGLGASGALSRIAVGVEDVLAPGHVNQTPYLLGMAGGDKNPFNHWLLPLFVGVIAGGFISGLLSGRVKKQTCKGPRIDNKLRWVLAFAGGLIMGYGARLARGCTSGQALSGGAVLSVGSWAFMFSMFAGAYAFAWFMRKAWT